MLLSTANYETIMIISLAFFESYQFYKNIWRSAYEERAKVETCESLENWDELFLQPLQIFPMPNVMVRCLAYF